MWNGEGGTGDRDETRAGTSDGGRKNGAIIRVSPLTGRKPGVRNETVDRDLSDASSGNKDRKKGTTRGGMEGEAIERGEVKVLSRWITGTGCFRRSSCRDMVLFSPRCRGKSGGRWVCVMRVSIRP